MAVEPVAYRRARFWVLLIGVFMIVLAAFGVQIPVVNLFQFGVGVCFASSLG